MTVSGSSDVLCLPSPPSGLEDALNGARGWACNGWRNSLRVARLAAVMSRPGVATQ